MSALRTFVEDIKKNQVKLAKQGGPAGARVIATKPAAAELDTKLDAMKVALVKRLASKADPIKKALLNNSPDASRIRELVKTAGTNINKAELAQVGRDLDELERLLAKQDLRLDDTGGQEAQIRATPDNERVEPELQKATAGVQSDVVKGALPIPTSVSCTVVITNNTTRTLQLDSPSSKAITGEFQIKPPPTINAGEKGAKIKGISSEPISFEGAEFTVKYFLDDEKTTSWIIHCDVPPSIDVPFFGPAKTKPNSAEATLVGPKANQFQADQPDFDVNADDVTIPLSINPIGGSKKPSPKPTPSGQEVNASSLITVTNNTQAVLTLARQENDRGDFMSNPAPSLQPGASTTFVMVHTPGDDDPEDQGCKGSVTWQVGTPVAAIWRCEWDNPVGEKNTVQANLDPESAGFESLEQTGQGDENVPVNFTISGGPVPATKEPNPYQPTTPYPPETQGYPSTETGYPPEQPPYQPPMQPPYPPPVTQYPQQPPGYAPSYPEYAPPTPQAQHGHDVTWIQSSLAKLGYNPGPIDGIMGPKTSWAIKEFQKAHNLQPDGIVDPLTTAALEQALGGYPPQQPQYPPQYPPGYPPQQPQYPPGYQPPKYPPYHCPPEEYERKPWEYEQGEKKPQSGGGDGGGSPQGTPSVFDTLKKKAEELKKKAEGLFNEGA
jgi:hypothetical protein